MPKRAAKKDKPIPPPRIDGDNVLEPATCGKCGATVLKGWVDGLLVTMDLTPLDARAELIYKLHHQLTYTVRRLGVRLMAIPRNATVHRGEILLGRRAPIVLGEHHHRSKS